jgi:holo-[acyl-carrier protein] synthase
MIIGMGNDILDVSRIKRELEAADTVFRDRVFCRGEILYCEGKRYPARHYAARFAAKEALFKALGAGLDNGFQWQEAEVCQGDQGKPELVLSGETLRVARQRGMRSAFLSLAHTDDMAMASVILEGDSMSLEHEVRR